MRVITGILRGKRLITVPGTDLVRPTSEKVKEAVFSSIQFDIEGRNVLDLFAGCGQMGIEALSRGAKNVTFVDSSAVSLDTVKKNLAGTPFEKTAILKKCDYKTFLSSDDLHFDIVFLDPPYSAGYLPDALYKAEPFINLNGRVFCEHPPEVILPDEAGSLKRIKTYKFGKILVTSYRKEN